MRRILLPLPIALLTMAAQCSDTFQEAVRPGGPERARPVQLLEGTVTFRLVEQPDREGGRPIPGILLVSEEHFGCGGGELVHGVRRSGDRVVVTIHGARERYFAGDLCPAAMAPASGWTPLPLAPGTHRLEFVYLGHRDRYTLAATGAEVAVAPADGRFTRTGEPRYPFTLSRRNAPRAKPDAPEPPPPVAGSPAGARGGRGVDPRVDAFVEEHDLAGFFHAAPVLRLEEGFTLFRVEYDQPRRGGLFADAYGLRYRGKVGWLDGGERPPYAVRRRPFPVDAGDSLLFREDFARRLAEAEPRLWRERVAPLLVRSPATPRETLARLLDTEPGVRGLAFQQEHVRRDLDLLLRLEGSDITWRAAVLEALAAHRSEVELARLAALGELLLWGPANLAAADALLALPAARRDADLLTRLASRLYPTEYAAQRRRALELLLRLPSVPDSAFAVVEWWTARPELVRDPRVRRNQAALMRLHWLEGEGYRALRTEAHRLLLSDPAADPGNVFDVAAAMVQNARRCTPDPYPFREHALLALAHPAARKDERIAQVFAFAEVDLEVRDRAVEVLTGRRPTRRPLTPAEEARRRRMREDMAYFQAHTLVSTLILRDDSTVERARAVLRRRAAAPNPPREVREWTRLLEETRDTDSLLRVLVQRSERMNRLRRASPFLELLTPQERDEILAGVGCGES
jgi:hypothetical protein